MLSVRKKKSTFEISVRSNVTVVKFEFQVCKAESEVQDELKFAIFGTVLKLPFSEMKTNLLKFELLKVIVP